MNMKRVPKLHNVQMLLHLVSLTHKAMITWDFDPVYPMLQYLTKGMSREQSIWYAFCYVGHYNLASGAWCFSKYPKQVPGWKEQFPLRFQRRNFYTRSEYDAHWEDLWNIRKNYVTLTQWLEHGMTGGGEHDFLMLVDKLGKVRGNGRWAGIKMAEVLKYTTFPHLTACTMANKGSAAPRKGLSYFYDDPGGNSPDVIEYLDRCGVHLTNWVRRHLPAKLPHTFGVAEMETNLCDFKSMVAGRFYSGKCADVVLQTLTDSPAPESVLLPIYHARSELFDHRVLGEFGGWNGVDPKRDKLYSKHGVIPWRWESLDSLKLERSA